MSYSSVGTVPVQLDGLNSALSPVVYEDIALSIKMNTHTHTIHNPDPWSLLRGIRTWLSSRKQICKETTVGKV